MIAQAKTISYLHPSALPDQRRQWHPTPVLLPGKSINTISHLAEPQLFGGTADSGSRQRKYKMSLEYFLSESKEMLLKNDDDVLKGNRKQPPGAPTGQIWNDLSITINNYSNRILMGKVRL